ncbi:MAG: hypothetical protein HOH04_14570 [Rhodospirillaceae bacterium]|nr:hypothetical protein [Rhodospirillaceae bacterium]
MALGKIFGTLFKDPDEGPTAEEIDAETEAAVRAIMEENTGAVGADAVLASGWGEPGDMVYIMNLSPLYGLLGERVGRAADNLRINCKEVFNKYVRPGQGQGSLNNENYLMHFYGLEDSEGFHRAAVITNEVGASVLGDRFEKIDVPELVIAAKTENITNADGSLNLEKTEEAVRTGGEDVAKTPAARVKNVQVAFYPTWTPAKQVIETFACYVRQRTSRGLVYGSDVYPQSPTDPLSILIDGKKSKLAVRDMSSLAHFETEVDLFLPLRFSTLKSKYAAQMAKIIEDVSPVWRNQHLVFEVLAVPGKATAEHLGPLVDWAKTQGRGLAVRTSFAAPGLDRIADSGAEYACFDYQSVTDDVPNFKDHVSRVHDKGLRAAIWNVSDRDTVEALIDAGFDLMNGPAIAESSEGIKDGRELSQVQVIAGY